MEHIQSEYDRGHRDSTADQLAGSPKLFWQTRGSWGDKLTELMRDRFSVTVEHTSDICWAAKKSYENGYNAATRAYVDQTFGADAFQAVMNEIKAFRIDSYRRYLEQAALRKS